MGPDTKEFGVKAKVFIMFKGLTRPYTVFTWGREYCFIFLSGHQHNDFVDIKSEQKIETVGVQSLLHMLVRKSPDSPMRPGLSIQYSYANFKDNL